MAIWAHLGGTVAPWDCGPHATGTVGPMGLWVPWPHWLQGPVGPRAPVAASCPCSAKDFVHRLDIQFFWAT